MILGIDPGGPGAAVLLHRGELCWSVDWRATRSGWKARLYRGGEITHAQLSMRDSSIGGYLAALLRIDQVSLQGLAVEDVFVHGKHKNVRTAVVLARFGAAAAAPIELLTGVSAQYVQASEWRASVLGLNRYTKRDQAKAASLQFMPSLVSGLGRCLSSVAQLDHLSDAAGLALWLERKTHRASI